MSKPLLETRGLTKTFGGLKAVQQVDLRVDANRIVSVIGPNGAGKTTLFNCLSGIYRPDGGTITLAGRDVTGDSPAVRDSECGLCVMHMLGEPQTMQLGEPAYDDVVREVRQFLEERVATLKQAGIARARISVDPGFGFGKAVVEHNYALLAHLPDTAPQAEPPYPILAGMSRKSMVGAVVGRPAPERVAGSIAAAVCAAERGAAILRVHDVAQTVDALKVWAAMRDAANRSRARG